MSDLPSIGEQVRVIAAPGGLFYGRLAEVVQVDRRGNAALVGVQFQDSLPGSGGKTWWFSPGELECPSLIPPGITVQP